MNIISHVCVVLSIAMDIGFLLEITAVAVDVGYLGSADEIECSFFVENLCQNYRQLDGRIVAGRLDNTRPDVIPHPSKVFHDLKLRINTCVALSDKDPCFLSPCNINEICYNHLDNSGYHCGCSLGKYEADCGSQWGIGFVIPPNNIFGLMSLPSFKLEGKFITSGATPPFDNNIIPIYNRHDGDLYYVVDDVLYCAQLHRTGLAIEATRNLTGYSKSQDLPFKIGRGGLAIDKHSKWLYVAHTMEGSIKRYPTLSLNREEIFFPSTDDVMTTQGISALALSNGNRSLFWMDLQGIMRCSLEDCHPTRVYSFAKAIPIFSADNFQIIIDDTKSGKMFWNERRDPQTHIVKMANQDGTSVESLWEDTSLFPHMLTHTGWLVRYDRVSCRFLYTRILEYTGVSSSNRSLYNMRWGTSAGTHSLTAIIPI